MNPLNQNYKLIEKKELTGDVFELIFNSENKINVSPGQFITFLIPKIGARAYSILKTSDDNLSFIIKKVEKKDGGKGGSNYLCKMEIGEILKGVGPAGNFKLKENNKNKLFLGTGTGFVPLFCMIDFALKNNYTQEIKFIFGVRNFSDLFYLEELKNLKDKYNNFSFEIYLSREKKDGFKNGYIIEFINQKTKDNFGESYICGNPKMVNEAKSLLLENGFELENIFSEAY